MSGQVLVERDGAVLRVRLSNPGRRNAITWTMYDELQRIRAVVAGDPDLRVVVIRGAGGEAFAAGTDVRGFTEFRTASDGVEYEHRVARVLDELLAVRVPVVAVVEGPAVGAGLAIAACCDVVVTSPDAVFGAPIGRTLGNCLAPGVVARLYERLGAGRTTAMLFTARMITAADAAAAGFVHQIAEREELDAAIDRLVAEIVDGAPLTLAGLKEIGRRLARDSVDADDVLATCYGSADFAEGVAAFLEHRTPHWVGR